MLERGLGAILKGSIFLALVLTFACRDDSDCRTSSTGLIGVSFFDTGNFQIREMDFDSIMVLGIDSVIFTAADSTDTIFFLPANPFESISSYVFIGSDRDSAVIERDTIEFSYRIRNRIITPDCGATRTYDRLDTIETTFDSLVIVNERLVDFNERNVTIFN